MVKINKKNQIFLTKGDTANISVGVFQKKFGIVKNIMLDKDFLEGSTLTLTVRDINENIILQKEVTDSNTFDIVPEDTSEIEINSLYIPYHYDIQLKKDIGIFTLVVGEFYLDSEVTYDE